MSLTDRVTAFVQAVGADIKSVLTSLGAKLDKAGGQLTGVLSRVFQAGGTGMVTYQNVAYYTNDSASVTGTIKIALPFGFVSSIVKIRLSGYNNAAGSSWDIFITGQLNSSGSWAARSVVCSGYPPFSSVRVGKMGGVACLMLGTTTDVHANPRVIVEEITVSLAAATSDWTTGWAISIITDETGFTSDASSTVKGTASQYWTASGAVADFNTAVRAATLTGLSVAQGVVAAADTVLSALGKLQAQLNARVLTSGSTGIYTYTDVGSFNGAASGTGTIKIALPFGLVNTLIKVRIDGYVNQSRGGGWSLMVSGHLNSSGGNWANGEVTAQGNPPFAWVRLGYDGSKACILLGMPTDATTFMKVVIKEVITTSAAADSAWNTGWVLSQITDETGITVGQTFETLGEDRGGENLLINGDFQINQRGFAGGALTVGVYGYDRWRASIASTSVSVASQVVTLTGAVAQGVEDPVNALQNKQITVSVEDPSANLIVYLRSASSSAQTGNSATITAGTGRRSVTITTPNTNLGGALMVEVYAAASTTFKRLKAEMGPRTTGWMMRPYAQELLMCQRYAWVPTVKGFQALGNTYSGNQAQFNFRLPVRMPSRPALTVRSAGTIYRLDTLANLGTGTQTSAQLADDDVVVNASGLTSAGNGIPCSIDNLNILVEAEF